MEDVSVYEENAERETAEWEAAEQVSDDDEETKVRRCRINV
jgi:hypothetical protein